MTHKMSDQQLNRALAEAMGYYIHITPGEHFMLMYPEEVSASGLCDDEAVAWKNAPDYCNDEAAAAQVQAAAIACADERYVQALSIAVWGEAVDPEDVEDWVSIDMQGVGALLTATPRQRAEAAYAVLCREER